ncbi:hypothetical protein PybrP1_012655 [[Pythium] brassicae (nom. inval.)]|nr:hypothetical protein PybrP1_012655 [[Pythium] brassicae (nom. inval.)]
MDKYEEIRCIGRGTYGSAHLVALRGSGERFVVKKIPTELLTEKEKAQAFREVELLAKLKHPNVVEYRENFVHADVIHIVMAYCDGGDLADKIRERVAALERLPSESDSASDGASAAAERRRAYFGVGQILDWFTLDSTLDQARTVVGTPYYMSPEVCENKPYSYASDVWALGCVLYEMCALKHAFDAPNIISLIFTIVRKEFAPVPAHFDGEISALLQRLLDKTPENRPSMDQIFAIPYIRNHMQGLVASGGSLRVNAAVRRPLGAPKKRVHAKNLTTRRGSVESVRRKSRQAPAATAPQWLPISPFDADAHRALDDQDDDLELLDASILEESQLDVRAPERSRTPEPLVCFPDETKPPPAPSAAVVSGKQRGYATGNHRRANAWAESAAQLLGAGSGDRDEDVEEEEDVQSSFQAEAEELMNPDFENEYSEECMDSRQIYYRSKSAKAAGRRESGRFRGGVAQQPASAGGRRQEQQPLSPVGFRPRSSPGRRAVGDSAARGYSDAEDDRRRVVVMKRFPLHVDDSIAYEELPDPTAVAAYEQWGRFGAHDDIALQLEDASLDNVAMYNDAAGVGGGATAAAGVSEAGHGDSALSSDDNGDDDYDDDYNDSGDEDDDDEEDYTSMSEYDAEENYYSDDSDSFEENDTQYSDDFEDGDAEVIEYANDEFSVDDDAVSGGTDDLARLAQLSSAVASTAWGSALVGGGDGARLEPSLTPSDKRQQKPPTEVKWVMRNVAQSLLQSHDDLTVA